MNRVLELHKAGLKQHEIAEEIGRHKSTVSRILKRFRNEA